VATVGYTDGMQQISFANGMSAGRLAYGCMRIGGGSQDEADAALDVAIESGYTLLDLADIYGGGDSERLVGDYLKRHPDAREKVIVQTKCGIRFADETAPGRYDLSASWITEACEASLERLGLDAIDIYLFHRPDPLMDPREAAHAVSRLAEAGKIRGFGVSNFPSALLEEIAAAVSIPVLVNQVELSIAHAGLITQGIFYNRVDDPEAGPADASFVTARKHSIVLQPWSPIASGFVVGRDVPSDHPERDTLESIQGEVKAIAAELESTPEAVAIAWLLKLPATVQPVIGTTTPERIRRYAEADSVELSRAQWYRLLQARLGRSVP
jgi:predicted oxidoreductase